MLPCCFSTLCCFESRERATRSRDLSEHTLRASLPFQAFKVSDGREFTNADAASRTRYARAALTATWQHTGQPDLANSSGEQR